VRGRSDQGAAKVASCRYSSRPFGKPFKVRQRYRNAASEKRLRDLDLPVRRDAATSLPPLGAGVFLCAEFSGDLINDAPVKGAIEHGETIGQSVQPCQDTMSQDHWTVRPYSRRMAENRELEFNEKLCARVHRLRNERGWTADQMATALGIPADRYRKYEYRSPMPHYLLEQFATIVGRDIEYLLLGKTAVTRIAAVESRRKRA
jgi:hypothetical protein